MKLFRPTLIALTLAAGLLCALQSARAGTVTPSTSVNARAFTSATLAEGDVDLTVRGHGPLIVITGTFGADGNLILPGYYRERSTQLLWGHCIDGGDDGFNGGTITAAGYGGSGWVTLSNVGTDGSFSADAAFQLLDGTRGPFLKLRLALAGTGGGTTNIACVLIMEGR